MTISSLLSTCIIRNIQWGRSHKGETRRGTCRHPDTQPPVDSFAIEMYQDYTKHTATILGGLGMLLPITEAGKGVFLGGGYFSFLADIPWVYFV